MRPRIPSLFEPPAEALGARFMPAPSRSAPRAEQPLAGRPATPSAVAPPIAPAPRPQTPQREQAVAPRETVRHTIERRTDMVERIRAAAATAATPRPPDQRETDAPAPRPAVPFRQPERTRAAADPRPLPLRIERMVETAVDRPAQPRATEQPRQQTPPRPVEPLTATAPPRILHSPIVPRPSSPSPAMRTGAQPQPEQAPVVHVLIEQVTVQAILPTAQPTSRPAAMPVQPRLTLDEYLKLRGGRR